MVSKYAKKLYMFLILLFLYAPIFVLIVYSFNESKSGAVWTGFTFKWYEQLFQDAQIMRALYYTIIIAILSSLIATIIGTVTALGISKLGPISKKVILNVNYLPMLNPDIVTGVSLMMLFTFIGLELGFLSMLLVHILFNIPYVILAVLPKIRQLPKNTVEAAMDLGATPSYAFWRVVLPQIMPGIVSGLLIAFTMSIDDFVISFFNTGRGVTNLSITIYSMARRGMNPKINALLTLMFLFVLIILLIINRKSAKEAAKK